MFTLANLGWDEFFEQQRRQLDMTDIVPGRVIGVERTIFRVQILDRLVLATASGRLHYEHERQGELPAVGDWVGIVPIEGEDRAVIRHIFKRKSALSRANSSGRDRSLGAHAEQQIIAANLDYVFIVTALDADFSLRRIERYIAAAWGGSTMPVVVLNKSDVCDDLEARIVEVQDIALGVPVHALSALHSQGTFALDRYLASGTTIALIGSSGVGKSTLINRLLGREAAPTSEIRQGDSKGRHTTTWRELFFLESGGILIDNPGLREIAVWTDDVDDAFADIRELATGCLYADCQHNHEPGCRVQEALRDGSLARQRFLNWRQLATEATQIKNWMTDDDRTRREGKQRRDGVREALRAKGKLR